jgi:hypothetical protein
MTLNEVLPDGWVEQVRRLAVAVQVVDAVRNRPAEGPLRLADEDVPEPHPGPPGAGGTGRYDVGIGLPAVPGRRARFAVRHPVGSPLRLRLYDEHRRFVPRRLTVPVPTLADVRAAEAAVQAPPWGFLPSRTRRVVLHPGAAYDAPAGASGLRGRVRRADGTPARWARVQVRHATREVVLGTAHADDRGEFLLVLGSPADRLALPRTSEFPVRVTVSAHPAPPLATPAGATADPLWDLPVEVLPPLGAPDDVSPGTADPPGYSATTTRTDACRLGRLVSPDAPYLLP